MAATDPTPPAPAAPALPTSIRLNADYSWLTKDGAFLSRSAGDTITDPDEIAYFVALPALFTVV